MAGIKSLRKLQLGRESSAGTAVAATTIWRGTGTIDDARELIWVDEDIGQLTPGDRAYIPKLEAALAMEDTPATFEQLPHILEAGVKTATASQDGSGSGYIYQYTFATTAANTIKTYTLEGGDNQQAEEMEYSFVSDFTISGVGGEAVNVAANWIGRQVTNVSFTGSLTLPTVEEILASKGYLYIDAASGTTGTTTVSSTLLAFTLNVTTGIIPKYTFDGNLYFQFIQYTAPEVTLDVTFEHNATAVTEKTNWRNETARLLRIKLLGSAFTTAGSTHSNKSVFIDLAGKWTNFDALSDQDGNDIVTATFTGRYETTSSKFAEILVVNDLSSLP